MQQPSASCETLVYLFTHYHRIINIIILVTLLLDEFNYRNSIVEITQITYFVFYEPIINVSDHVEDDILCGLWIYSFLVIRDVYLA